MASSTVLLSSTSDSSSATSQSSMESTSDSSSSSPASTDSRSASSLLPISTSQNLRVCLRLRNVDRQQQQLGVAAPQLAFVKQCFIVFIQHEQLDVAAPQFDDVQLLFQLILRNIERQHQLIFTAPKLDVLER
ncbi:hypothetical protein RQP46_011179 [Phenoliferia psychrophenolica]